MGQHFPLAATALGIKNGIENLTQVNGPGMTTTFGLGQQRCEDSPLGITQVTGVGLTLSLGDVWATTYGDSA